MQLKKEIYLSKEKWKHLKYIAGRGLTEAFCYVKTEKSVGVGILVESLELESRRNPCVWNSGTSGTVTGRKKGF